MSVEVSIAQRKTACGRWITLDLSRHAVMKSGPRAPVCTRRIIRAYVRSRFLRLEPGCLPVRQIWCMLCLSNLTLQRGAASGMFALARQCDEVAPAVDCSTTLAALRLGCAEVDVSVDEHCGVPDCLSAMQRVVSSGTARVPEVTACSADWPAETADSVSALLEACESDDADAAGAVPPPAESVGAAVEDCGSVLNAMQKGCAGINVSVDEHCGTPGCLSAMQSLVAPGLVGRCWADWPAEIADSVSALLEACESDAAAAAPSVSLASAPGQQEGGGGSVGIECKAVMAAMQQGCDGLEFAKVGACRS
jgi:hypothetical protein